MHQMLGSARKHQTGYEINFNRTSTNRSCYERWRISADILTLERETEGLLVEIVGKVRLMPISSLILDEDSGVPWLEHVPGIGCASTPRFS